MFSYVAKYKTLQFVSCRMPLSTGIKGIKVILMTGEVTCAEEPVENYFSTGLQRLHLKHQFMQGGGTGYFLKHSFLFFFTCRNFLDPPSPLPPPPNF